ncbi:MAG TPA: Gldg family protein, partial [Spirochaetia bacterium]|nr:Gldg family protein [Spirochaetia bacterium]
EQRVTEVYSGLVIQYLDRSISIPFVFNPDTLEYSLTLTIRRLVRNTSSVAGIIIGGTDKSLDRNYSMLSGQLSLSFNLRDLKPGEEIPPNISVLIVLGGTDLSREQLAPIDRYIMGGGRVLFAVKGLRVETNRKLDAKVVGSSPLLDMIANYGVEVGREMVLDESSRDYRLPQVVFGTVKWQVIGKYPEWVSILPENVSETNPITRRFPGLDLLWPSPLTLSSQEGVSAEVLLRSSASSWLATAPFTTDPFKLVGGRAPKSSKGRFVLAYALSGRFPSYYTGGDETETATPAGEGVKDRGGRLGGGDLSQDTRMIIIGDDDFASDLMQFSDSAYNALFLENAAEWLSSDSDLLAIKTRVSGDLRLNRIQDPKARERHIQAAEAINVVGIPLFVLAMGLLRLLLRREGRLISRSILRQHKGEKRR